MACQTQAALPQRSVARRVDGRRWFMLTIVLFATFMGYLDTSIINVSVLSIERALHASFAEVQLVIVGYTLAYAVLLATGGRLGDLYGRKRLFLIGVSGFMCKSFYFVGGILAITWAGKRAIGINSIIMWVSKCLLLVLRMIRPT